MKSREYNSQLLKNLMEELTPLIREQSQIKMQLAANIEDLIKSKGWTQIQFSKELNKTQPEISKWLSGAHNFTIDTLIHISLVLDVNLTSLFEIPQPKQIYKTTQIEVSTFCMSEKGSYYFVLVSTSKHSKPLSYETSKK